tara:strand:- start:728 stop:1324 length:597 start_codon:yes stop_codon:yes gene_type:complete
MGIFDFFKKKISNYQMCLLLYQLVIDKREIDYKSLKNSTETEILKSIASTEYIEIAEKLCRAIEVLKIDNEFQSSLINVFCETDSFNQLSNNRTITKQYILALIDSCDSLSISDLIDFLTYLDKLADSFDNKTKNNTIISNFLLNYQLTFQITNWRFTAQTILTFGVNPNSSIKSRRKLFDESSEKEEVNMVNLKKNR